MLLAVRFTLPVLYELSAFPFTPVSELLSCWVKVNSWVPDEFLAVNVVPLLLIDVITELWMVEFSLGASRMSFHLNTCFPCGAP